MPAPTSSGAASGSAQAHRQHLMGICAAATIGELTGALEQLAPVPDVELLRPPETGLVMLRARIGGDGAQFNFGEATATRAVVRMSTGEIGFSYLLGRSIEKARLAAIVDALGQCETYKARLQSALIDPVTERVAAGKSRMRGETAATRVNFFTLVRGKS